MTQTEQKDNNKKIITLGASHMANDMYQAIIPTLAPYFVGKFAVSTTLIGMASVAQQLPSLLQLVVGRFADRRNMKYWMIFSPLVTSVVLSCLSIAPFYSLVIFLIFISGFSSAVFHAIAPVCCGQLGKKRLGRSMSIFMVGGEIGRVAGPLMVIGALSFLTFEQLPWLMLLGFSLTIVFFILLRDIPFIPAESEEGNQHFEIKEALKTMAPVLLVLCGILFTRNFLITGMTSYLTLYQTQKGADLSFASISLSVMQIAGAFGALLGGTLSDSLGRRKMLLYAYLLTPIATFLFIRMPIGLNLIFLMVLGFANISMYPVLMTIVQEQFPEFRAFAMGIFQTANFIFYSIDVTIMGKISDGYGFSSAYKMGAVIMIAGIPLLLLLPKKKGRA